LICGAVTGLRANRALLTGENFMKYALLLSAALLLVTGQAQPVLAQGPTELLKLAVEAQGGVDALRAVKFVMQKAEVKHWEPGQSHSVNGEARFLGDSTYTLTADPVNRIIRYDWERDMKFPAVERVKYTEILHPTYGVVIDEKGTATPMSGIRLAAQNREARRGTSQLVLRAFESPESVSPIADAAHSAEMTDTTKSPGDLPAPIADHLHVCLSACDSMFDAADAAEGDIRFCDLGHAQRWNGSTWEIVPTATEHEGLHPRAGANVAAGT